MSHYDDEAQVAELKKWWQENWMALAGGLVLGLAGIFGWETWQKSQVQKSEQASQVYEDLKKALADRPDQAKAMGDRLTADFASTPYATQGMLLMAQAAVTRQDLASAESHLRWVLSNSDDDSLRKISRLRLAQVLWQSGKADAALAQLDIQEDDSYAALFFELRGDIKLSQDDRAAARSAYEKAMALGPAPASRELLQRKLNDLVEAKS